MGGSSSYISKIPEVRLLLFSLVKIEEIHEFLKKINNMDLKEFHYLKIFQELSSNKDLINDCSNEINKLLSKNKVPFLIEEIYKHIILSLSKDIDNYNKKFQKKKNLIENDRNTTNISKISYDNKIGIKEESLSLKEKLFIGKEKIEKKCLKCKEKNVDINENEIIYFSANNSDFNKDNLFKKKIIKKELCHICKEKTNHLYNKIKKLPKIFLIVLKNIKEPYKFNFGFQETINYKKCDLISFITNENEVIYKND